MDAARPPLVLHASHNAFLFETLPLPAWIFDPETLGFLAANDAAIKLFGHPREELLAMPVVAVHPAEERPRLLEAISRLAGDTTGVWTFATKDGAAIILETFVGTVTFEGREARLVVGHDITREWHAEEALRAREAFLQCLIESSPDCVKVLDLDGRLLSMSLGGQRLLEIEDIRPYIGQSWVDMLGDDASAALAALDRARRGDTARFEGFLPTFGGTPKWWEVIVAPIRGPGSGPERLLAISRDITERKRAEQALGEQAEEFQRTFDLSGVGQAQTDPTSGRFIRVNRKLCAMLGYPADELLQMTFADVTHPDERDRDLEDLRRLVAGELEEYAVEQRHLRKDGSVVWAGITATMARDAAGRPLRTVAVIEDITERRRIEQERAQLYAEARDGQRRLLRLQRLGDAIAVPSELDELLPRVAARLIDVFECDGAGLLSVREVDDRLVLRSVLDQDGRQVRVPAGGSVARVTAERRLVCVEDHDELAALDPLLKPSGLASLWVAPLSVGNDEVGILYLGCRKPRALSPEERLILRLFADRMGAAIHKSRLYGAAQTAQAEARAGERRAQFLAEAGRHLAGSLNYAETLQTVARLAVPFLADYCFFDVVEPGSGARRVAWQHANPARQAMFDEVARYVPSPRFADHPVSRVLASGQPILIPEVTDEWMQAAATSPDHLRFMRALQMRSVLSVPLRGHTGLVGILTCATAESGRRYMDADLRLAEEVALRAAMAIENARLYEAAVASERDAAEADRAKDRFLAVLGHELRNPLAPIVHAVHLLDTIGVQTSEAIRLRAIITRQARRLTRLVDELLDVSRIRLGKITLKREPVDFHEAVQKVFEAVEMSEQAGGHDLALEPAGEALVVGGDRLRLEQVIANLLDNALKYSPAGGPIRVSVWREDSDAVLSVRDQGVGIPPELLSTIFEPLVQADTTAEQARRGLGLGLAVVRSLVELHGGTVWAESDGSGHGSEFIVRLPLLADPAATKSEGASASAATARLSILLVDDDHDVRRALQDVLTASGHAVAAVATGLEGLKALKSVVFDVALIDLDLPLMDGCELARCLRLLPIGARLRLVALTGHSQPEDRRRAAAAGFDDFLVKPVETDPLLRAMAPCADRP